MGVQNKELAGTNFACSVYTNNKNMQTTQRDVKDKNL
jgi:hypothetical protein